MYTCHSDTISLSLILTKALASSECDAGLPHQRHDKFTTHSSLCLDSPWQSGEISVTYRSRDTAVLWLDFFSPLSKLSIRLADPYLFLHISFLIGSLHLGPLVHGTVPLCSSIWTLPQLSKKATLALLPFLALRSLFPSIWQAWLISPLDNFDLNLYFLFWNPSPDCLTWFS